jgi:PHD/YefM family antitoxin component YafN of YafNO toxin-antitoxin module
MTVVSATEFVKNFGKYGDEAQREPIAITNYGRVSGYYMSAVEYREYERVKSKMRHTYSLKTVPGRIVEAGRNSKMDPRHDHLNALLDDTE